MFPLFSSIGSSNPEESDPWGIESNELVPTGRSLRVMCRNITMLRGLEPEATDQEIRAAALQYVRKVGGLQKPTETTAAAMERAVDAIAAATAELLAQLPARRQPPPTLPPLRRPEVRSRLGLDARP